MAKIKLKIKKGDKVIVISGKDKGKTGVVKEVFPKDRRLIIEKVNVHKKSHKPTQDNPEGGIYDIEKPIPISKVMLTNSQSKSKLVVSRVGYRNINGTKKRILCKTGEEV